MNPVFHLHVLQADIHVCEIDQKIAPKLFDLFQSLSGIDNHAPKYIGIHSPLDTFHSDDVVRECRTCSPQIAEFVYGLAVSKRKVSIEEIKRRLKLFTVNNRQRIGTVAVQAFDNVFRTFRLLVQGRSDARQIGFRDSFEDALKITQGWEQQPFNPEPIGAELQCDELSVSSFTLSVANSHLADRVPSRDYCSSSTDQRLKVVNEITPSISPDLPFYDPCIAEEQDYQSRSADHCGKECQRTIYKPLSHNPPVKPYRLHRSHVLVALQSWALGTAA
ncbi:hypothetical protein [Agrobacterium tumefaciens]|uniref:hypothetical protein n=1 Tax=Agrobacterium tumefaciens TaxID=358 RepID=UPI0021FB53E8|nr:hypothetical protein FY128_17105 [Agrobacterium tumefaciens]